MKLFFQVLQISVGGQFHREISKRIKVVGLVQCNFNGQVTVTLRPYGGKDRASVTRNIPCTVDSLMHYRRVTNGGMISKNILQPEGLSCLGCSHTWLYYIDPYHWAEPLWTSTRMVITVVLVFCFVSLFMIFIKFGLCVRKRCC